jgi:hypothetical protein
LVGWAQSRNEICKQNTNTTAANRGEPARFFM